MLNRTKVAYMYIVTLVIDALHCMQIVYCYFIVKFIDSQLIYVSFFLLLSTKIKTVLPSITYGDFNCSKDLLIFIV